ncbi:MAG: arsenate reductase ArsC [Chloroflexi bacterium]|nr:arsenate reductase ArsC [Chloroflexota bacterium]
MSEKLRVLLLCTANSARSQMGEGLLRHLADGRLEVFSAGAEPASVNPYAIRAMNVRGIDISGHSSDHIDQYRAQSFDYVITVCDNAAESCPAFPGPARRIHWSFPDPAAVEGADEAVLASFINVRDGLEARLRDWLESL